MKVAFTTLGCRVNQEETRQAEELVLARGHDLTREISMAELIIVNTCSVTHLADRKSRQAIRATLSASPTAKVIVTGCMIEEPDTSMHELSEVSIVKKQELLDYLSAFLPKLEFSHDVISDSKVRRNILIQNGCNYFCNYCVIPYVRAVQFSKPLDDVQHEIAEGLAAGVREFTFTGINLGTYASSGYNLERLLQEVSLIEDVFRYRLGSIEPNLVSAEILQLVAENRVFARHFHIPLQGGTDRLLTGMGRRYTLKQYRQTVARIRQEIPDVALTTDLIIGFPGESEEDFKQTLELLNELKFQTVHVFPYSARKGTKAFEMPNQVNPTIKKERVNRTLKLVKEIQVMQLKKQTGQNHQILIEEIKKGFGYGFASPYFKVRIQESKLQIGQVTMVRLADVFDEGKQCGFIGQVL